MSHVVQIQTRLYDPIALKAACRRLGLAEPVAGTAKLYSGEAAGRIVHLPGWKYPAVVDTHSGTVHFDDYEGAWGDRKHLDRLLQLYAVEKARLECRKKGLQVTEQALDDGSIRLQIVEGH